MTTREKIAHILRRFGLGASKAEVDFYEKLGVEGALDRLINYEKHDEGFNVSPWELANRNKERINLQPQNVVGWWILRMMVTQRPLQEKLTLFWHDHFAVSASKVTQGPLMLQYLETLRQHANGNFRTMLEAVSKDPAMLLWLDNNTNVKGKPNENFARELMELFTMGIGHYTEKDVQEASRAFTGWTFRRTMRAGRRPSEEDIEQAIEEGKPFVEFFFRPMLHDVEPKTILGETRNWSGEDVTNMLAARPETARLIPSKLWEWFAYPNPGPKLRDKLAKVYSDGGFEIKPILKFIAESNEFWSDKCVRKQVKNPVDFTMSLCRQLGVGAFVMRLRADNPQPTTQIARQMLIPIRAVAQAIARQGMELLYPPDVDGWAWGNAWISSATMVERIRFGEALFTRGGGELARYLGQTIVAERGAQTSELAVNELLKLFDAQLAAERKKTLVAACEKAGGPAALLSGRAGTVLFELTKLLFATPEFQFC